MSLSECDTKKHNRKEDCIERKILYRAEGRSKGNVHVVVTSEGFTAVGALAGARGETLLDTIFAEDMAACFDCGVLEIATADCAQCE
jgi:hypothetical protein